MGKIAYTLKRRKDTNELHLFEGEMVSDDECKSKSTSVCGMMEHSEGGNIFQCEDEQTARERCAKLGRQVCGVCVSTLYATFKK